MPYRVYKEFIFALVWAGCAAVWVYVGEPWVAALQAAVCGIYLWCGFNELSKRRRT